MQVAWACSLEGGGGSKSTYGAYATTMEQDCKKIAKDRSHEGSKKWKMCKNKWNVMNFDYKKLVDYHKGTKHLPSFWELTMEKWEEYHWLR